MEKKTSLKDILPINNISEVELINNDIILHLTRNKSKLFLQDIYRLEEEDGIWKYYKKCPLILKGKNNSSYILYTNGYIFQYGNKYFKSNKDLVKKYFGISLVPSSSKVETIQNR